MTQNRGARTQIAARPTYPTAHTSSDKPTNGSARAWSRRSSARMVRAAIARQTTPYAAIAHVKVSGGDGNAHAHPPDEPGFLFP